jgi:4-hydroxyphenylpyruvate dioxygenase-like putative hemolysin
MELNIPAIEGIGGSRIYLVDRRTGPPIHGIDFVQEHGALFVSTERDQIRSGVLKAPPKG